MIVMQFLFPLFSILFIINIVVITKIYQKLHKLRSKIHNLRLSLLNDILRYNFPNSDDKLDAYDRLIDMEREYDDKCNKMKCQNSDTHRIFNLPSHLKRLKITKKYYYDICQQFKHIKPELIVEDRNRKIETLI